MRLYLEVARRTAHRIATYRAATVAGVFTNTVFGFLLAYVLLAVYRERPEVGGFDAVDAVTFVFLAQGLLMTMGLFGDTEMADRITTGDVIVDLQRPFDHQAWWYAVGYGKGAYYLVFRGVPPLVVGALFFDLRMATATDLAAFLVTVFLGVGVASGWRYLVQLSAFWLLDVRGANQMAWLVAQFLAGAFVPIFFFPDALEAVARALPFASMLQVPVEVWLGRHRGVDLLGVWTIQVAWTVALAAAGRLVLSRAVHRVVVQGG